jgi:hypothetical protein
MRSRPRARGSGSPIGRFGPAVGVWLERVKGIEPSSHAWEARALPLSYTRPFPKGMDYPLGVVCRQTHLAIGHPVEVSAPLGRGNYRTRIHSITERRSLFPQSFTRNRWRPIVQRDLLHSSATLLRAYPGSVQPARSLAPQPDFDFQYRASALAGVSALRTRSLPSLHCA